VEHCVTESENMNKTC